MAFSKPEKDLFLCPICAETLKSPKILTCLHTFCEECIHEYIVSLGRNKEDKLSEFPCPICKITTKPDNPEVDVSEWACTLRSNSTMSSMISEAHGNGTQNCDVCREHNQTATAQFWCDECTLTFCDNCKSKHNWIPFLKTHNVCSLEEFRLRKNGIDLGVISEKCGKHPSEVLHMFCSDHNCICCITCAFVDHRKCKNVKTITAATESDTVKDKLQNLTSLKEEMSKLLKSKRSECDDFEAKANEIENDAAKLIKSLKFKLDELLETFTKQLHILRDDRLSDMDARVRMLNQLTQSLEHWIHSADIVKESGSKGQFFIYMEIIDKQLNTIFGESFNANINNNMVDLAFEVDQIFKQVQDSDQLGTISVVEKETNPKLGEMDRLLKTLGFNISPTFETLKVKKANTIFNSETKIKCGVSTDGNYILLGNYLYENSKICLMDKAGSIIFSIELSGSIKRLCYISKTKHIYISCYLGKMFRTVLHGVTLSKPILIKQKGVYVGDLKNHRDHIYIVSNGAIEKIRLAADLDKSFAMTKCFDTNTDSTDLNGIHVEDDFIIFSTRENEIKCVAFDGKERFCYKHASINSPKCLTVLSSGIILIGDGNGSLHVLSADGKQSRVLLDKFETIKSPTDMWLDIDGDTLYIAGDCSHVEVYSLTRD